VGATDAALAQIGRGRRVALSVPSFLLAPAAVLASDLVAVIPKRLAQTFAPDLAGFAPPLRIDGFAILAAWHPRRQNDPAHEWLRQTAAGLLHTPQARGSAQRRRALTRADVDEIAGPAREG
jgi:DNA-binding transcriptional LysR family regulator